MNYNTVCFFVVFFFFFPFLFLGPTEKFIFKRMPLILSILHGASGTKL